VFDSEGEYLREWGGAFFGPRGITVTNSGKVYMVDTGNHRVRRFSPEGVEELTWGGPGSKPGKLQDPYGITTDPSGRVYVCDNGNGRVQIFDADGHYESEFAVRGWRREVFSEPKITRAPDGTLWVTVPALKVVRGYTPEGKLVREINGREVPGGLFEKPLGIGYSSVNNELLVTDLENKLVRLPLATKPR